MGEGKILKRGGDLQKYNVHAESTLCGIFQERSPIGMQAVLNCIWHKLFRFVWEIRGLAAAA